LFLTDIDLNECSAPSELRILKGLPTSGFTGGYSYIATFAASLWSLSEVKIIWAHLRPAIMEPSCSSIDDA
jgi:hypothetical protein